jgi:hypothetical protein
MTVDLDRLARDLAAAYYLARLWPDPTLSENPSPAGLDAYLSTGRRLLRIITEPERAATIRCPLGSRQTSDAQHSVALATFHDRRMVIEMMYRGRKTAGLRRSQVYLFDLDLLRDLGIVSSITTGCWSCEGAHDLPLRWLRRARHNDFSDRISPLDDSWDAPPISVLDQYGLAFANWIGAFPLRPDQGQPIIATTYLYAASYYHRFGADPPHGDHLNRLALRYEPDEIMPGADRITRPHPVPELLEAQLRIVGSR